LVYEARYLAWNCELKTRLSDIVSHLRKDCRQIVTQQLFAVFFFSYFIQLCDSRKIHYLTREFRVKLHLKTDIALIALRFVRHRFSRAI